MTRQLKKIQWAIARLIFIGYIGFSVLSLVGGFLTAPLMTWYFFGDWRFWRYWSQGRGLLPHAFRLIRLMMSDNRGFMFSVPLTSPPRSRPDPQGAALHGFWPHGSSCGDCSNCCRPGGHACPMLDEENERCSGYDSFYWRYFNCGRFPSAVSEIDYYDCRKWVLASAETATVQPVTVNLSTLINELHGIRFESAQSGNSPATERHDGPLPAIEEVNLMGRPAAAEAAKPSRPEAFRQN